MKIKKTWILYGMLLILTTSCLTQYKLTRRINTDKECRRLAQNQQVVSKRNYFPKRNFAIHAGANKFKVTNKRAPALTGKHQSESINNPVYIYSDLLNVISGDDKNPQPVFTGGLPWKIFPETGTRNSALIKTAQTFINRTSAVPITIQRNIKSEESHIKPDLVPTPYKQRSAWHNNAVVPVLVGLSGLLAAALLTITGKRSRTISRWASANPWKARGIIAGSQIAAALGALVAGNNLYEHGMMISEAVRNSAITFFATSAILYPSAHSRLRLFKPTFIRKKIHDIALFTSGTLLMVSLGNNYSISPERNSPVSNASFSIENFKYPASCLPVMLKDFSAPAERQDQPGKMSVAVKIVLLLLAIGAFVGLSYLLALLSCSIACGGSEGLAYIVFFGGEIGLLVLLILSIKGIFGKHKKQKKPSLETGNV
jgi:hypothetical protein